MKERINPFVPIISFYSPLKTENQRYDTIGLKWIKVKPERFVKTHIGNSTINKLLNFKVWCPQKGHAYLNKPAALSMSFLKTPGVKELTISCELEASYLKTHCAYGKYLILTHLIYDKFPVNLCVVFAPE